MLLAAGAWLGMLAAHERTPAATLRVLAGRGDVDAQLWVNRALPPDLVEPLLRRLRTSPSDSVRGALAGAERTTIPDLAVLAGDPSSLVRQAVARNARTPHDALRHLAVDTVPAVRFGVASNVGAPDELLRRLERDTTSYINSMAGLTRQTQRTRADALRPRAAPRRHTPGRLAGAWAAQFDIGTPRNLTPTAGTVHGRVTLAAALPAPAGGRAGRAVHDGTFDVDFRPFGFALASTEALAWDVGPDSLRVVLHPGEHDVVDIGGSLYAAGDAAVDSIVGRWHFIGDRAGADGLVVLRRIAYDSARVPRR